jgi:hypothetical protein
MSENNSSTFSQETSIDDSNFRSPLSIKSAVPPYLSNKFVLSQGKPTIRTKYNFMSTKIKELELDFEYKSSNNKDLEPITLTYKNEPLEKSPFNISSLTLSLISPLINILYPTSVKGKFGGVIRKTIDARKGLKQSKGAIVFLNTLKGKIEAEGGVGSTIPEILNQKTIDKKGIEKLNEELNFTLEGLDKKHRTRKNLEWDLLDLISDSHNLPKHVGENLFYSWNSFLSTVSLGLALSAGVQSVVSSTNYITFISSQKEGIKTTVSIDRKGLMEDFEGTFKHLGYISLYHVRKPIIYGLFTPLALSEVPLFSKMFSESQIDFSKFIEYEYSINNIKVECEDLSTKNVFFSDYLPTNITVKYSSKEGLKENLEVLLEGNFCKKN